MKTTAAILGLLNLLFVPLEIYLAIAHGSLIPVIAVPVNLYAGFVNWNDIKDLFKKDSNEINIR